MDDNNIARLRRWFRSCPLLRPENPFNVDYLGEACTEYALFASPASIATFENVLGERVPKDEQELDFIFMLQDTYGNDVQQNVAAYGLLHGIVAWIIEQNAKGNLPMIQEGTVKSIMPTLTPYVSAANPNSARYQIQIKLKYRRR